MIRYMTLKWKFVEFCDEERSSWRMLYERRTRSDVRLTHDD